MRNASGHQGENERQWKKLNRNIKPRANGATMLDVTCCVCLHTLLHVVACCYVLLGIVAQSLKPLKLANNVGGRKCLEVSRRSRAKQRQRNVQKKRAARAKLFFC